MFTINAVYRQKMKEALVLALPIVAGQMGQVLMGLFDTIQIGGLGSTYIATTGFANNVYWLINLLGMGILFAISPLVSESFGEKNGWKAIGVFRSGMWVSIVLSVVFTVITFIAIQYISVFGQDASINPLAQQYLRIVNRGTVAILLFSCGKQLLDGMGRTWIGMVVSVGGLLLNVFLNWLLIYGHMGLPAMGIEGAATATTVSRFAMTAAIFIFIWRDKQITQLRVLYNQMREAGKTYILPILKIGIPSGLQFFFEVAAFSITQMMSGWLGVVYLASHQIAIGLASTTFMFLTGIAAAGTILTGYAYGAKDKEGARVAGNTIFMLTIGFEIIFALVFLLGHNWLPHLYTNDAELIGITSSLLILAAFFQLSDGLQSVAAGALRGLQDVTSPSIIAFISYWLIMVPACYLLAFKTSLGVKGIWIGFIIGLSISAIALLLRFRWKVKNIQFQEL